MNYTDDKQRDAVSDTSPIPEDCWRSKRIRQLERELAEANAHAARLQNRLAEVQAEKSDALIAAVEEIAAVTRENERLNLLCDMLKKDSEAVTAERDALKADLCAFAVDMEKQLFAVTAERDALKADKERLDWLCDTHAGLKWQRLDLLVSRGAIDAELAKEGK